MTLIPADTKDAKSLQIPHPMPTMYPFPDPIIGQDGGEHDLPPYSETDTASQTREPAPLVQTEVPVQQKLPESNAVNARGAVELVGPLHILGYV